jgi:dolichyl-phosphate beta-glucosyltransferase
MAAELSIVVPAYNEAGRLGMSLRSILDYLRDAERDAEVVVVDDGSGDTTAEVAQGFAGEGVRLLRLPVNRGKGAALRQGVLASRGRKVLLSDADLSTPIAELERLERHLADPPGAEEGAELVLGSRAVAESQVLVHQPFYRELMGRTFNRIVRLAGVGGLSDTQCGFKLLDGEVARRLFAELTIDRFAYDVELILLARRHGYRVVEVGVSWAHSEASRVHPVFDSARMLWDVLTLRWRHRRRAAQRRRGGR